ncbi:hypothetical protein [Paraliobacillus salinarum]|uniref:hypothetical protein n=1 Tax=Paraliobacillus salinarum TaxID=1158996 RepID=UPI0015F6BA43|nr:hypothetical protein [Paraliobacillus salinarum]
MKTLLLTTMAGALLFTGGFAGAENVDATNTTDQLKLQTNILNNLEQYTEYEVLDDQIDDLEDYNVQIVEDNQGKRVIMLTNNNQQFKSIFIKETNRLKIIDFGKGPIFNQVITGTDFPEVDDDDNESEEEEENESTVDVDDFIEFDTLEEKINADDDHAQIVEDNESKRVMLVSNEDNQKQYKSIFVKDTNRLKIIDLKGGEVFNQIIQAEQPESDDDENESEENESATDVDDFIEFDILEEQVNADDDSARIVEDNPHKRVMFVSSEDSHKQYKSIFVKDTNRLKIIDLQGGQIFNEIIK